MIEQQNLEEAYREYCNAEIDRHIASLQEGDFEKRVAGRARDLKKQQWCSKYSPDTLRQIAMRELRSELAGQLPEILSFEAYCQRERRP